MIGGILFGLIVCTGMYLLIGLGISAIADNARTRRIVPMADEDEVDYRYYGNHYGDGEDY